LLTETGLVILRSCFSAAAIFFPATTICGSTAFSGNAGGIWAPAGLDHDSFAAKLLANGGVYTYPSGRLHTDVHVTQLSGSVLPGWRMNDNNAFLGFYVGPIVQDYKLSPYDPKSLLRGFYTGAQMNVEGWYQPSDLSMIALDGSVASIPLIGSARAATGWRVYDSFFAGPEAQALWCVDYHEWRPGAHITAFRLSGLEWTAAAGAAIDSFNRLGPYAPASYCGIDSKHEQRPKSPDPRL
jgi:hypothetical protein